MIRTDPGWLRPALAWLAFPLVPALLGRTYFETLGLGFLPVYDPQRWDWSRALILAGPLFGYGFLAGATLNLPDEPAGRGMRSWPVRRALWVGVGPWAGFVALSGVFFLVKWTAAFVRWVWPASREWDGPLPPDWWQTWWGWLAGWTFWIVIFGLLAFGWLPVATAACRRARRLRRLRASLERGLVTALAFVGSLFGSFWAITSAWRSFFFDPRVVPLLLVALSLAMTAGCASTMTYGEMRRGQLFKAMLMAWLLGLALAWRWWSRPREPG